MKRKHSSTKQKVRYAVVGLGDIAQGAILPSFSNAQSNSELVGLVSSDSKKLRVLSRRYKVALTSSYEDFDELLKSDSVDAVYIALPNSLHCEFAVKAARSGKHILLEKPLAVTEQECKDIIEACSENDVKLMTAYRLHFERANLEAVQTVTSGRIGEPRIFQSLFTMQVKPGNIRVKRDLGGGTLYDIGIYCINAARSLFRAEPTEVFAFSESGSDPRFREIDEMTSAVMRFPKNRLASFTTSFGAADSAVYTVSGTKGVLRMVQAYEYSESIDMELKVGGRTTKRSFELRDQFAPELIHFSDCILHDRTPEPSGLEGLADVRIIRALYESAKSGNPVALQKFERKPRPDLRQEIQKPPVKHPAKVRAESASQ